ncbi:hypothetical protein BH10BAC2_BH10BAC2_37240 [soil metagenome]
MSLSIIPLLLKEMEEEAVTTRKMLLRVPADKFGWKPHERSMAISNLTVHIAELPSWVAMTLNTNELNFEGMDYTPTPVSSAEELLAIFEKSFAEGKAALEKASEDDLLPDWTLRTGDNIHSVRTKYEVIRMSFCQTVHHRAQLGVYLRLLNIPIPGSYGPSADETNF